MKKKYYLILFAALCTLTACSGENQRIRFGTAGIGGVYHTFGNAYAQVAGEQLSPLEFDVKATAGSAANLRLISDDYLQLAITQADIADAAYRGTGIFTKPYQGYGAVAALYTEACQIIVRADSGITSIEELHGKTVSLGEAESGSETNARQILLSYGLNEDMIHAVHLNYSDAAVQLENGTIDAFFCTVGVPATVVTELSRQCDIRILNINDEQRKRLTSTYDFYIDTVIPSGTYSGQDTDIHTVGVKAILVASEKLSEAAVTSLTRTLFEQKQQLQYSVPAELNLEEVEAVDGISIPFHPGAVSYYQEQGLELETEVAS